MTALGGTWYVVPTAFRADGAPDLDGQRAVVDGVVSWGVDGLTLMGVMSEATSLTDAERSTLLRVIIDTVGRRVPIAVGCSAATVSRVAAFAVEAAELGADAVMVSAPTLARNLDALPGFFASVAKEVRGLDLIVQDEPAATGTMMPLSLLLRCLEASGARTVKLEDPPTPPKITRLLDADPTLQVFGGLGGVSALWELRRGACGTMTGFSFPEVLAAIRRRVEARDLDGAAEVFDRFLPMLVFEGQLSVGLAVRKENLRRRGVLLHATTRGPAQLDDRTAGELDDLFARLDLKPGPDRLEVS